MDVAVPELLPVSVVIPAYNRPDMVTRAVHSAFAQRPRPPAEVIVVDDCSSDATGAAASAAGARVIRHVVNRGEGAARNTAIRAAAHDWIALLDSDDEFLPDHLAALWPHRDPHVVLGSSAIACAPDPADDILLGRAGGTPEVLSSPGSLLRRGNALVTSSVMVRRDVAIAAGLFAESLERSEDLDLWLRVLELGTGYVGSQVTVRYHMHAGQISGDIIKMSEAYQTVVDAYRGRPWFTRSAGARSDARLLWDRLRHDLRTGRRAAALRGLWQIARDPYRARALVDLLGYRFLLQRRRWSYTRSGAPTIRVWTSRAELVAAAHDRSLAAVEPLQSQGFWAGLPAVLHRPAGLTVTDRAVRALAARIGGSKVVRVRRGGAGALDGLVAQPGGGSPPA